MKSKPLFIRRLIMPWMGMLVGFFVAVSVGAQTDSAVRGQVTDSGTGFGIEGAQLTLDAVPADGTPEFTVESDVFGFFAMTILPAGNYRLRAAHPGYAPAEVELVLVAGATQKPILALTPLGPDRFDISLGIKCVTSGVNLGGVPVQVERYATADATTPVEVLRATTGLHGEVFFRGAAGGWYGFRVNDSVFAAPRPQWSAFSHGVAAGTHAFLNQAHHANVRLNPLKQTLIVNVRGFDPVKNLAGQPLEKFIVEVTGVDPLDPSHSLMPPQTSVSDEAGQAMFSGLPAIAYQVVAKRVGYAPAQALVQPGAGGILTAPTLTPILHPTHLFIVLGHPYTHSNFVAGLRVEIEGQVGTVTEGIRRAQLTYDARFPRQRAFFNLMPGNYRVVVNGTTVSGPPGNTLPRFIANEQVDALEGVWTDLNLPLTVEPGRIRGQLYVADEMANEIATESTLFSAVEKPVYRAGANIPIEIVEYEGDSYLIASLRTNLVSTDAQGEFSLPLLPGRYGVKIPEMTNHWGHSIRLRNLTTTVNSEKSVYRGWPYPDTWPFSTPPPGNSTGGFGNPVLIRSGHDYQMDLFVQKQIVSFVGEVDQVLGNNKDSILNGVATLIPDEGEPVEKSLIEPQQGTALYHFTHVPPGRYRVTFAAPHYDVEYSSGTTSTRVVTIPQRPAPGVIPDIDPVTTSDSVPFTRFDLGRAIATYIPPATTIKVVSHRYGAGAYAPGFETTSFDITALPDGWDSYEGTSRNLPHGTFDYWVSFRGNAFFPQFMVKGRISEGETKTHDIYWGGGPLDTELEPGPPVRPARWVIRAVNALNVSDVVSNALTTVTLSMVNSNVTRVFGGELIEAAWPTTPQIRGASNPNWVVSGFETRQTSRNPVEYLSLIKLRRGTAVRGTVVSSTLPAVPLRGMTVRGLNRFGGTLVETITDEAGAFNFAQELDAAPLFIDVDSPGYVPWRQRFTAADAVSVDSDDSTLNVEIRLELLPPPVITATTLDRFGVFFPGLNRVGDQFRYSPSNAFKALSVTWTLTAEPAPPLRVDLPRFDSPTGAPGAGTGPLEDPLTELWLIDPRSYTNRSRQGNPTPLALPTEPNQWRHWLRAISSGTLSNVFYHRVLLDPPRTNSASTTNQFQVWKLPEGPFDPVFAAVSRRGGVAVQTNFSYASERHRLHGVRMPPWLAFNTDVLGSMAAFLDNPARPLEVSPKGRFVPRNLFTAGITQDAGGFLNYDYTLDLDWREGMENPGGELLDFLTGFVGLEFQTGMQFGLRGATAEAYVHGERHDVFFDSEPLFEYIPLPIVPIARVSVDAAFDGSKQYLPVNDPFELEMTNAVSARLDYGITAQIDFDLEKYFSFIGGKAKRLGLGGAEATLRGATELGSQKAWKTAFPPARPEGSSVGGLDQVYRRHLLGGEDEMSRRFDLCFYGEANINVSSPANLLAATLGLAVQGATCTSGKPSVQFAVNPEFDWPPLLSLQAELDLFAEFKLNLWVKEYGRRFEVPVFKIQREFTTTPLFQLIPVRSSQRIVSPRTATPAVFSASGTARVSSFYGPGSFAATSSGTGQMLAFTDVDPTSGMMLLKASRQDSDGLWKAPVTMAAAPGIVNVAVTRSASQWVMVWTQLEAAGVDHPFPPSTLVYSHSADGVSWSPPATLASLSGVATQLKLSASGNHAALALLETGDGPTSTEFDLKTATWNGATWTSLEVVLEKTPVRSFEIEGATAAVVGRLTIAAPAFHLAWLEHDGVLRAASGMSFNAAAATIIATNAFKTFDLVASSPVIVAWRNQSQQIELAQRLGAEWVSSGPLPFYAPASDLRVHRRGEGEGSNLLIAWTSGAPSQIQYAWLNAAGSQVLQSPVSLTSSNAHRGLNWSLGSGGEVHLFALREDADAMTSLLELSVPFAGPASPARLRSPRVTTDGSIEFYLQGESELRYRIQESADLRVWTDLATEVTPSDTVAIRVPISALSQRYYRAVSP